MFIHAIDWGDVPTWVSAVTTTGALIAAGIVVRVELARDRRQSEASERAEQADLVAVWPTSYPMQSIVVHNGSSLPVYSVVVDVSHQDVLARVALNQPVPPGDYRIVYPSKLAGHAGRAGLDITFADTAGRSWVRTIDGHLSRMHDDYAEQAVEQADLRTKILPPQ